MNKKGFFTPTLVFMTILLLGWTAYLILTTDLDDSQRNLGESQTAIISTYQEAENKLFYIEQVAKISQDQAIDEFMKNGGMYDPSLCQQEQNYVVWDINTNCDPNIKENFIKIYLEKLNQNLAPINIRYNPQEIKIMDNYILTETTKEFIFTKAFPQLKIDYSAPAVFKIPLKIDLDSYETLKENILNGRNCLDSATKNKPTSQQEAEIISCIDLPDLNIDSSITKTSVFRIIKFDVSKNERIFSDNALKLPFFSFSIKIT